MKDMSQIKNKSINVILVSHTLHHIRNSDIKKIIENFYRILTDDGIIILKEHNCISKEFGKLLDIQHMLYDTVISQISTYDSYIEKFYSNYKSIKEWNNLFKDFKVVKFIDLKGYDKSYISIYKKNII